MRKLAIISILAVTAVSQASLINGDFESPAIGGYGFYTSIPGWNAAVDKIEIGQGTATYGVTGATGQVLELDANNNATVEQQVNLSAGSYLLSFDYARRLNGMSGKPLDTANFDVLWNDVVVYSGVNLTSTTMQNASLMVTGLAGMNSLKFRGMGTNDSYGALIDNADLQAVPEPATMAVLSLGVAAMLRRRKK